MLVSVSDAQLGMDVLSSDGTNLGRVNEIYNSLAAVNAGQSNDNLYMAVSEGDVVEFWKPTLYIPFSQVRDLLPGRSLTISATADEARAQFAEKPAALNA